MFMGLTLFTASHVSDRLFLVVLKEGEINMSEQKRHKSCSAALEETLASFGALSAVSRIRKCYPDPEKRFDQHYNVEMDITARV